MDFTKKKNLCKRSITQKCKQFSKTHFQRETERIRTPRSHSTRDKRMILQEEEEEVLFKSTWKRARNL
jgi:hypothetical protein